MADVTLTYKGQTILELSASGTKAIKTAGKYCEGDIGLAYVRPGAGNYQSKNVTPRANQQTVLPDSGYSALSQVVVSGDADLVPGNIKSGVDIFGVVGTYDGSMPEPALPDAYQRVEYLEFVPAIGIVITLPTVTDDYILFEADCLSTKNCTASDSADTSDVFGMRFSNSTGKDFELGFRVGPAIYGFVRDVSRTGAGLPLFYNKSYTLGERTKLYIILKEPRSTALIGKYAYYSSSGVNGNAFQGKFYGLKGTKLTLGDVVAWFVPCYRKSDNQVGVYDHIAQAFYYETYAVGSGYSITAGPDVN